MMMTMMMEEWTLLRMRIDDDDDDGDDGTRNIHTKARKEKKSTSPTENKSLFL